jgi:hypothetical protein
MTVTPRASPNMDPGRPPGLPDDPAKLAESFIRDADGDLGEAHAQAAALAIVATELGDVHWQSRARMAAMIVLRRMAVDREALRSDSAENTNPPSLGGYGVWPV